MGKTQLGVFKAPALRKTIKDLMPFLLLKKMWGSEKR